MEKFTDAQKGYTSETDKKISIFKKATGLNKDDLETAVMQPRKVQYIEETIRDMASGELKIRTRSLENEAALKRLNLRQSLSEKLILSVLCHSVKNECDNAIIHVV